MFADIFLSVREWGCGRFNDNDLFLILQTVVIVGGLASQKQERLLKMKPEVVIATPGRLWELVKNGDPHLSNFNQLRYTT